MTHRVVFSPEASEDLLGLYDYIAERSGGVRALRYIERIEGWCESLQRFPERYSSRRYSFRHQGDGIRATRDHRLSRVTRYRHDSSGPLRRPGSSQGVERSAVVAVPVRHPAITHDAPGSGRAKGWASPQESGGSLKMRKEPRSSFGGRRIGVSKSRGGRQRIQF